MDGVQEDALVTICDGDKDKYRFGFNGQEKVNEWAGIGNHNTAKFWEYDTRTAQRLNLDPVVHYSLSPYTSFDRSPIWKNDVLGNVEKIMTIMRDFRSGKTTITLSTANRVMTDGIQHTVWDDGSSYHWENYYYDYNTVVTRTIDKNGKEATSSYSYIPKGSPIKDRDDVWFGGNKKGDTKIESWSKFFDMTQMIGGVVVYGSAINNSESVGKRHFKGKILGSFDFGKFSEMMETIITGMEQPDKVGMNSPLSHFGNAIEDAKDLIKNKQGESEKKFERCKSCGAYGQNGKIINDTSGKGITPGNTEKKSFNEFHKNNE